MTILNVWWNRAKSFYKVRKYHIDDILFDYDDTLECLNVYIESKGTRARIGSFKHLSEFSRVTDYGCYCAMRRAKNAGKEKEV